MNAADSPRRLVCACTVAVLTIVPALARAQQAPLVSTAGDPPSRLWIVVGGASTTLLGQCTDCPSGTYLHSGALIGNFGGALNRKTDLGAEVLWTPATVSTRDRVWSTFIMASVQFRPWQQRGFFVKAAGGIAFVRNWLFTIDPDAASLRSKAFALGVGAGWEWRTRGRFGFEVFGSQHVAALGDLESSIGLRENVIGNFWSVGGALVIR